MEAVAPPARAGGHDFQGNAYEFSRNSRLNAYHFFRGAAGRPRRVLNRNQFGGAIGGPVGEDKFFFLATEDIF